MWQILSDPKVLRAIGERIRALRLDRDLSQSALAEHAGISLPTVQRLEAGQRLQVENLVRVLRSLGKLDALEAIFLAPPVSPMALATQVKPMRKRAPRVSVPKVSAKAKALSTK
ncbi:MAG: helix-turn-helix domain-containing protein [Rhodanobacter sp.]